MAKLRKRVLCYSLDRRAVYGTDKLFIRAFIAEEDSIQRLLEGTVDNKAGYGSEQAAQAMNRHYGWLLEQGHGVVLEYRASGNSPSVTVNWMELRGDARYGLGPSYGGADVEQLGGGSFEACRVGIRLMERIGKKAEEIVFARKGGPFWEDDKPPAPTNRTFASPTLFIKGIEGMGGRRVTYLKSEQYTGNWVYDTRPRFWLLSDSLIETFEMWR